MVAVSVCGKQVSQRACRSHTQCAGLTGLTESLRVSQVSQRACRSHRSHRERAGLTGFTDSVQVSHTTCRSHKQRAGLTKDVQVSQIAFRSHRGRAGLTDCVLVSQIACRSHKLRAGLTEGGWWHTGNDCEAALRRAAVARTTGTAIDCTVMWKSTFWSRFVSGSTH